MTRCRRLGRGQPTPRAKISAIRRSLNNNRKAKPLAHRCRTRCRDDGRCFAAETAGSRQTPVTDVADVIVPAFAGAMIVVCGTGVAGCPIGMFSSVRKFSVYDKKRTTTEGEIVRAIAS